jgi:hypothetical protein
MGKGGRLSCKNSGAVQRQLGRQLAPYSKERRSFLCSVATAGAGLAGSAFLSLSAEAQRKPEASPKGFAANSCGNSRVIASDKTVAATIAAGRSSKLTDAITRKPRRLTYMPPLQQLVSVARLPEAPGMLTATVSPQARLSRNT